MGKMKVLLTGAAGMLGTDLAHTLFDQCELVCVDQNPSPAADIKIRLADLTQESEVERLWTEIRPEVVIHAAAMTNVDACELQPEDAHRINVKMTEWIAKASQKTGAFVIFISTDYVFSGDKQTPYTENDATAAISQYGKSKEAAEKYLRQVLTDFVIIRISWLYGLHGKSFPRTILEKSNELNHFEIVGDQKGRPTYTLDLARGLCEILQRFDVLKKSMAGQIFHLTNQDSASWAEFAEFILSESGRSSVKVTAIDTPPNHRPAPRPRNSMLDLSKAEKQLGIRLRSWKEAVKDFLHEYKGGYEKSKN